MELNGDLKNCCKNPASNCQSDSMVTSRMEFLTVSDKSSRHPWNCGNSIPLGGLKSKQLVLFCRIFNIISKSLFRRQFGIFCLLAIIPTVQRQYIHRCSYQKSLSQYYTIKYFNPWPFIITTSNSVIDVHFIF